MNKNTDLVYHYCSVESFINIIRSSSIWLSDYRKMNDFAEEKWIKDKADNKLREKLKNIGDKPFEIWSKDYEQEKLRTGTFYVGCFSEDGDDLTQWTRYADDGRGVAIGFSKEQLIKLNKPFGLEFCKTIYDEKEQDKFVNQITKKVMQKFDGKSVMHVAVEFFQDYTMDFLKYKNPGFYSEKEWRIVYYSSLAQKNICYHDEFRFLKPDFRVSKNRIISYIPLNFSEIKKELIKEICLGPSSKVTINDILNILNANDYYKDIPFNDEEPIKIIKSKSTYHSY